MEKIVKSYPAKNGRDELIIDVDLRGSEIQKVKVIYVDKTAGYFDISSIFEQSPFLELIDDIVYKERISSDNEKYFNHILYDKPDF